MSWAREGSRGESQGGCPRESLREGVSARVPTLPRHSLRRRWMVGRAAGAAYFCLGWYMLGVPGGVVTIAAAATGTKTPTTTKTLTTSKTSTARTRTPYRHRCGKRPRLGVVAVGRVGAGLRVRYPFRSLFLCFSQRTLASVDSRPSSSLDNTSRLTRGDRVSVGHHREGENHGFWKREKGPGDIMDEISYADDVSGMLHVHMTVRKCHNGELVDDVRQNMHRLKYPKGRAVECVAKMRSGIVFFT